MALQEVTVMQTGHKQIELCIKAPDGLDMQINLPRPGRATLNGKDIPVA
jgi:hypothetical protein